MHCVREREGRRRHTVLYFLAQEVPCVTSAHSSLARTSHMTPSAKWEMQRRMWAIQWALCRPEKWIYFWRQRWSDLMDQMWEWDVVMGSQWRLRDNSRFWPWQLGIELSKKKLLFSYHEPNFFLCLSCWQVHASGCPAQKPWHLSCGWIKWHAISH